MEKPICQKCVDIKYLYDLCPKCEEEMGEQMDVLEIQKIVSRRGWMWVIDKIVTDKIIKTINKKL